MGVLIQCYPNCSQLWLFFLFFFCVCNICMRQGRRGGLMVSALVPGVGGPGSSPGRGHCVVFLNLTVPLSTQVYKWVPVNCWENLTNCRGMTCDGLASCPQRVEILLAASCYRNRGWSTRIERLHFFYVCVSPLEASSVAMVNVQCLNKLIITCMWLNTTNTIHNLLSQYLFIKQGEGRRVLFGWEVLISYFGW